MERVAHSEDYGACRPQPDHRARLAGERLQPHAGQIAERDARPPPIASTSRTRSPREPRSLCAPTEAAEAASQAKSDFLAR